MYPVLIAGSMVMLRELTDADTAALHEVYGNDEATRHLSFEPRSMEQVAGIIAARSSPRQPSRGPSTCSRSRTRTRN